MESKKLRKSSNNRVLCGVCAGIAEYLGIDPVIIRLLFAVLTCISGLGIIAYIIAIVVIPEDGSAAIAEDAIQKLKQLGNTTENKSEDEIENKIE